MTDLSGLDFAAPEVETRPVPVRGKQLKGLVSGSMREREAQKYDLLWIEVASHGRRQRDISQEMRSLLVYEDDGSPVYGPDGLRIGGDPEPSGEGDDAQPVRRTRPSDAAKSLELTKENAKLEERIIELLIQVVQMMVPDLSERDSEHIAGNSEKLHKLMVYLGYRDEAPEDEVAPKKGAA